MKNDINKEVADLEAGLLQTVDLLMFRTCLSTTDTSERTPNALKFSEIIQFIINNYSVLRVFVTKPGQL
jgi:hypothetical protein